MSAELDTAAPERDRWSFVAACVMAVLGQFTVLKSLAYRMATEATIVGVVVWSADIAIHRFAGAWWRSWPLWPG